MPKPEARIIHWQGNEITVEVSDEDDKKFIAMVTVDTPSDILNSNQGEMYIRGALKIGLVCASEALSSVLGG